MASPIICLFSAAVNIYQLTGITAFLRKALTFFCMGIARFREDHLLTIFPNQRLNLIKSAFLLDYVLLNWLELNGFRPGRYSSSIASLDRLLTTIIGVKAKKTFSKYCLLLQVVSCLHTHQAKQYMVRYFKN